MTFFDQLDQCLQQHQQQHQRALEGTPSPSQEPTDPSTATQASTSKTSVDKQPDLIKVQPRTKTAKHTFVRKYLKTVMAQPPEGEQEIYPTLEEIMSVTDYMKAVQVGCIKAGLNHKHIKELAKLPHAGQTKVIVLTYDTRKTKSRATQIYLKKRKVGTHPPYVLDPDDSDQLLFNFMQPVVQQAQQHMFQQLKQCMQQAYTGLTLGTPVRAKEYTKQFKKNNNTLVLTETKRLDVDNTPSEWDDNQDSTSGGVQPPSSPLPPSPDHDSTTPKSIQPSTSSFGGARNKTALPTRATHSTAVVSGRPAGFETDGEYEDYFNPRIFTRSRLIATSPAFAAAVNLHRPYALHPIETVHGPISPMPLSTTHSSV